MALIVYIGKGGVDFSKKCRVKIKTDLQQMGSESIGDVTTIARLTATQHFSLLNLQLACVKCVQWIFIIEDLCAAQGIMQISQQTSKVTLHTGVLGNNAPVQAPQIEKPPRLKESPLPASALAALKSCVFPLVR